MIDKRENASLQQFNRWAATYEKGLWSSYFRSAYRKMLFLSEKHIKNDGKVLDIGCGTGELTLALSEKVPNGKVVGLDISNNMIELAEKKRLKHGIENVQFIQSQTCPIPYGDNYFNAVFCLNSLHHFPKHADFFREVNRVLKKGGKLFLLDLIKDNVIRRIWILIIKFIFGEKEVEFHKSKELLELIMEAGLKPEFKKKFMFFTLISVSTKVK